MKKLLALLLALLLVATVFAGCSNSTTDESSVSESSKESQEDKDSKDEADDSSEEADSGKSSIWLIGDEESAELSLTIQVSATDLPPEEMWFFQYYEEMTGVTMNVNPVLSSDWGEKKSVLIATGDYTDIIWKGGWTSSEIVEYGGDGTFLDLRDYFDYMPNFMREMDMIEDSWSYITTPDGAVYTTCAINPTNWLSSSGDWMWINYKWLEAAGLEKPQTLDEFYNALVAFRDGDMDGDGNADNEIPFSGYFGTSGDSLRTFMLNSFGFDTAGATSFNIALASWDNDAVVYIPLTERYKEYLVYMNKLMEEGLLDRDVFSQDDTQYKAKTAEAICGVIGGSGTQYLDEAHFDHYDRVALKYDKNAEKVVYQPSGISVNSAVITDACKNPALAAKWIDIFYAPEHAYNLQAGPIILEHPDGSLTFVTEGITEDPGVGQLVKVDENGNYVSGYFPGWEASNGELGAWDWLCLEHPANGMFVTTIGEIYYYDLLFAGRSSTYDGSLAEQKNRYENYEDNMNRAEGWTRWHDMEETYEYLSAGYPTISYLNADDQTWIDENKTILEDYVLQMEAKFITGAADIDAEYDAFIEELKKLGAEKYQEIYANAYVK